MVKKPQEGANYDKFFKTTLYSPAPQYHILGPDEKAKLKRLNPEPLLWSFKVHNCLLYKPNSEWCERGL